MSLVSLSFRADESEVLRYLGYKEGTTKAWPEALPLREVQGIVRARGLYLTYPLEDQVPEIKALNDYGDIRALLQGASKVSFLAVTLGHELDDAINQSFKQGNYARAAILDAVGSAAAEAAMEELYALVNSEAILQGYSLTHRFSPGYGDFALDYQQVLCAKLNTATIGLAVTNYSILLPRKSVTAIAGWKRGTTWLTPSSHNCTMCNLSHCGFRREEKKEDPPHA